MTPLLKYKLKWSLRPTLRCSDIDYIRGRIDIIIEYWKMNNQGAYISKWKHAGYTEYMSDEEVEYYREALKTGELIKTLLNY